MSNTTDELRTLADQLDPQPQPPEALAQIREDVKSALNELDALAAHAHEFRMTIPARNTDSDVMIGNALHSLDALLQALDATEQRAERYLRERNFALELAEEAVGILPGQLAILRGAIDLADGQVQPVTGAADVLGDDPQFQHLPPEDQQELHGYMQYRKYRGQAWRNGLTALSYEDWRKESELLGDDGDE